MNPLIALAAGGTGGHFFPAEALARALVARGYRVVIFTDSRGEKYADRLKTEPDITLITLPAAAIGAGIIGKLRTAAIIAKATLMAWRQLKRRAVSIMVTFGGYPSFAPALAGKAAGLPLILHEQATKMSLANQKLLPLATRLATSFPVVSGTDTLEPSRIVETGNPVRAEIAALRDLPYNTPHASAPLYLVVTGGSQSAQIFGDIVPPAVLALPEAIRNRLHLSLQYKGDDAADITARLSAAGITADIAPFFSDMADRLAKAHLLIGRAGATTAAELLVVGRPAILVPIPKGGSWQEQLRNARTLEELGAGWCIPQDQLTSDDLSARLARLFNDPAILTTAAAAAHKLGQPQAATKLADLVETTLS